MKSYQIAVIPGDGIGLEVIREGIKILDTIAKLDCSIKFEYTFFPWGCEYYNEHGVMMDEGGIEILSEFEAIYLGAVGHPSVPDHISLWDLLLKIRKSFNLLLIVAIAHNGFTLLLDGVFLAFGYGTIIPSMQAVAVRKLPANHIGLTMSTFFICMDGDWSLY